MADKIDTRDVLLALGGVAAGAGLALGLRAFFSRAKGTGKRVAVILSGSGVYDGTEIQEAVAVLVALADEGAEAQCFAPDMTQHHCINHFTGDNVLAAPLADRNVLHESARIARGKVKDVAALNVSEFDALVFPGGFGVAKNLSTYGHSEGGGADCKVLDSVSRAIRGFHDAGKPIGFSCIAPVLAACLIKGVTVTLGRTDGPEWPYSDTITTATKMGANVVEAGVGEIVVDSDHKVVTTPAYMCATTPDAVAKGIAAMVRRVVSLA